MTEPPTMESLETRLDPLVRRYTAPATGRPFDATAVARTAMTEGRAVRRGRAGRRWAFLVAAALLGAMGLLVVAAGALRQPPPHPVAQPVPESLRHVWARPYGVTPGGDEWGSGFLTLTDGRVDYGREPGAAASTSSIAATGPASLEVTATAATKSCKAGDAGAYGWSLTGRDTVLTLTPITADACAARQRALGGPWVRNDFPPELAGTALSPGTHETAIFDPLGDSASPTHLQFAVPEGWQAVGDEVGSFALRPLPVTPSGESSPESIVGVFANPRMTADFKPGAACGLAGDEAGVGGGLDDLVNAIVARPGVVSTPPAAVTIAGHEGRLLDLQLSPSWTGGCVDPTGPETGMQLLHQGGSTHGPVVGLGPNAPLRLILLDLGGGRTLAIAIAALGEIGAADFEARRAAAMAIIDSFQFVPASR